MASAPHPRRLHPWRHFQSRRVPPGGSAGEPVRTGIRSSSPSWARPTRTAVSSTAWAAASRRCRRSAWWLRRAAPDADIDYTFAQISVKDASVDYSGNCGNMSSAIGPFAIEEGLVPRRRTGRRSSASTTPTRRKIIVSRFPMRTGARVTEGDLAIDGVAGTSAPVRLEFTDPGGAKTGRLLPTGRALDILDIPGLGPIEATLVDAANPCVFVRGARPRQDRQGAARRARARRRVPRDARRRSAARLCRHGPRAGSRRRRARPERADGGDGGGAPQASPTLSGRALGPRICPSSSA